MNNHLDLSTTIMYRISGISKVKLSIYHLLRLNLVNLVNELQTAGEQRIQWDLQDLPSGIYFVRMQSGSQVKSMKLALQK